MDIEKVKKQAKKEFEEEQFRVAVDEYKNRLKQKSLRWSKIFPYKILIVRKDIL